ncbi:hypothetical protein FRC10_007881 [Ceratobasidium sp. 414]|nr:hypothetical protein FRC10_007881 [Ceratobasidium sp. 414]
MGTLFWDSKVVALYGFKGASENELSFNRGEVMSLGMHANLADNFDWMYCKSEGGHVFCRPCLDTLVSTPKCPNCRALYTARSIRKVVCSQQDQDEPSTSAPTESEAETLIWQAIQSSMEAPDQLEQRKSLVTYNSPESVREAGMSVNLLIALDALQMVVKTEQRNRELKDEIDIARAVEGSLYDRISVLEAQLSKPSLRSVMSQNMQLLIARVRALQSLARLARANLVRKLSSHNGSNSPAPPTTHASPRLNVDRPPQHVQQPAQPWQREQYLPHAWTLVVPRSDAGSESGSDSESESESESESDSDSGSGMLQTLEQLVSPLVTRAAQAKNSWEETDMIGVKLDDEVEFNQAGGALLPPVLCGLGRPLSAHRLYTTQKYVVPMWISVRKSQILSSSSSGQAKGEPMRVERVKHNLLGEIDTDAQLWGCTAHSSAYSYNKWQQTATYSLVEGVVSASSKALAFGFIIMFILQECSICFEDFDNERNPHTIPCGHVFCHPCLNSLIYTPNCPNCRKSYSAESIRKVVCVQQESVLAESEEETLMWQAIKSAVETPNEDEQRKSLVKHNSLESVREAGMSALQNLIIALDVLRMLVEAEQQIHGLKDEVGTAQAVEESLCDHISTLEAQLGGETSESSLAPAPGVFMLLAQVRALQSSVQLIKSDTSTIVRHLNIESTTPVKPLAPIQQRSQPQPPTLITPDPPPGNTQRVPVPPESWPYLLLPASPRNSNNNSPSTSTAHTGSNPNADRPQHVQRPARSPQQDYFLSHTGAPSMSGSGDTGTEHVGIGGEVSSRVESQRAEGIVGESASLEWAYGDGDNLQDLGGLQGGYWALHFLCSGCRQAAPLPIIVPIFKCHCNFRLQRIVLTIHQPQRSAVPAPNYPLHPVSAQSPQGQEPMTMGSLLSPPEGDMTPMAHSVASEGTVDVGEASPVVVEDIGATMAGAVRVAGPMDAAAAVSQKELREGVVLAGQRRNKMTPEELAEKMEKIRLQNEKIKQRRERMEAEARAFEQSITAEREAAAARRRR